MLGLTVTTPGLVAPAHDSGRRRRLERRRHVAAVTVAAGTLGATVAGWTPSPTAAVVIVLVAVAVGLPHGALDVVIGPSMAKPIVFLAGYLGVASVAVLVWLGLPLLGFGLFFSASWYHFARGDADHRRELGHAGALSGISTAGCAIGLPLALHSETVAPVLSNILLGTATLSSDQVEVIGVLIAAPSIICGVLAGIAAIRAHQFAAVTELTAIAALAAVVHPLVSFALYFSMWHSPRHLIALDIDRRAVKPTLTATAATLLVAAVVWRVLEPSVAATTQVIFIGLAALTGPHLVVTEMLRVRNRGTATGVLPSAHHSVRRRRQPTMTPRP